MQNKISATVSAEERQAILDDIASIRTKLPFLEGVSPEDKQSLPKLGDKSRAFVQRAVEMAEADDSYLPRSFDVTEFRQDLDLFLTLDRISQELTTLSELVEDTRTLVGSDAYVAALDLYAAMKRNGSGQGLDELADLLAARFARRATGDESEG